MVDFDSLKTAIPLSLTALLLSALLGWLMVTQWARIPPWAKLASSIAMLLIVLLFAATPSVVASDAEHQRRIQRRRDLMNLKQTLRFA